MRTLCFTTMIVGFLANADDEMDVHVRKYQLSCNANLIFRRQDVSYEIERAFKFAWSRRSTLIVNHI